LGGNLCSAAERVTGRPSGRATCGVVAPCRPSTQNEGGVGVSQSAHGYREATAITVGHGPREPWGAVDPWQDAYTNWAGQSMPLAEKNIIHQYISTLGGV
jgi:hypothetical protein